MKGKHFSYCIDEKGFIFPINLYIDSIYGYFDDFCVQGKLVI